MDPKQIAKQIVDFNKTAFDNSFEAMSVIQDQTEKMVNAMMEQTAFFPEEGKKAVTTGLKHIKKAVRNSRRPPMRISKKWKFILRQSKIIFISVKKATAIYRGGFFDDFGEFRFFS